MNIKAITTHYKDWPFRSRIEARWAVYFDALKLEWSYEPEGFHLKNGELYLPDFWMPGLNCYAEVKPKKFTKIEYIKCSLLSSPCILLDTGYPKTFNGYYVTGAEWSSYENYLSKDEYGRVILPQSKAKGRLWFLFGESTRDYWMDTEPETMAKSARFGESHARYL